MQGRAAVGRACCQLFNRKGGCVMKLAGALAAVVLPAAVLAAPTPATNATRREWGPAHLQEVCHDDVGCYQFGKIATPVDHQDASYGEWDMAYFVNSHFWDPVNKPNGPIFINMGYGSTSVPGYTRSALFHVGTETFARYYVGTSNELAEELGALIINVPNRYYGCGTARADLPEGSCPTPLEEIPEGEDGVLEAHARLRFLTLKSVADDLAHVSRETITTFAEDWGMVTSGAIGRAPNQPIVFGCSWPGTAAVYSRMLHPDIFPGAVATSHPMVSSPTGNDHYRSFVGSVYELYSAGGSLECRNLLTVGHQELGRRIEETGEDNGPVGSCFRDCTISATVNADFGLAADSYRSFGSGIPGLPGVQTINRGCTTLGCNIENTCGYLRECFATATDPFLDTFPISADEPRQAQAAYQCLVDFSDAVRNPPNAVAIKEAEANLTVAERVLNDERGLMEFNPENFEPLNNLGPRVYESNTLTYQLFGFQGPMWMTQTCNDGSGCPFVQGNTGGSSLAQTNAWLWANFGTPGEDLAEFEERLRAQARAFNEEMGGQRPWEVIDTRNIYMVYNDADPWTAPGVSPHMPVERGLTYDLGGGGISHCVDPGLGAQDSIRQWATVPEQHIEL